MPEARIFHRCWMPVLASFLFAGCVSAPTPRTTDTRADSSTAPRDGTVEQKRITLGTGLTTKRSIEPGTYEIVVLNRVPTANYRIEGRIEHDGPAIIDPLSREEQAALAQQPAQPSTCSSEAEAVENELRSAKTEEAVVGIGETIASRLSRARCSEQEVEVIRRGFLSATTLRVDGTYTVSATQDLVVRIFRDQTGDIKAKEFPEIRFETPDKTVGKWIALYGVNYIESDDESFFAQANPSTDPQTYTITEQADRSGSEFSPSIYFMFIREAPHSNWLMNLISWNSDGYFGGVTAGIGFDFDSPTAFLGYGVGFGHNIMLNAGVAMRKVDRLNGRYEPDQVITENLSDDQLTEETYEPGLFLGLSFRFGSNPFKKTDSGN